jgi:hypothetical protein
MALSGGASGSPALPSIVPHAKRALKTPRPAPRSAAPPRAPRGPARREPLPRPIPPANPRFRRAAASRGGRYGAGRAGRGAVGAGVPARAGALIAAPPRAPAPPPPRRAGRDGGHADARAVVASAGLHLLHLVRPRRAARRRRWRPRGAWAPWRQLRLAPPAAAASHSHNHPRPSPHPPLTGPCFSRPSPASSATAPTARSARAARRCPTARPLTLSPPLASTPALGVRGSGRAARSADAGGKARAPRLLPARRLGGGDAYRCPPLALPYLLPPLHLPPPPLQAGAPRCRAPASSASSGGRRARRRRGAWPGLPLARLPAALPPCPARARRLHRANP